MRFDDVAGCLRTPAGGSSRQTIHLVDGENIRSRLLSAREATRPMGLPVDYRPPARDSDAYALSGDRVSPPVARHIAECLLKPLVGAGGPGGRMGAE